MAQYPQLFPGLALLLLRAEHCKQAKGGTHDEVREELAGRWRPRPAAWRSAASAASPRARNSCSACNATAPDRRRPSGTVLCPGYHDYVALVNSKGGVEGYKIKVIEIDNEYKVPPAMEAHERFKKEGAVLEGLYGTPQTAALTKKLEEDKILGTSPGFGTAAAADGKRYPYIFPIAASYWSQGGGRGRSSPRSSSAAASRARRSPTCSTTTRPARSRCRSSRTWPRARASSCAPSRCRRRASRWARRCSTSPAATSPTSSSPICSAARRRSPSRSSRARATRCSKVVAFVWGSAGGRHQRGRRLWRGRRLQHHPVRRRRHGLPGASRTSTRCTRRRASRRRRRWNSTVYYNRGVMIAALHVEAVRNAIKAKGGAKPTSEDVKKGMEPIKGFTLGGLVPPMEITPADHEGGGWVQVWTVKGGKLVKAGDWFQGYRDVIKKHLAATKLTCIASGRLARLRSLCPDDRCVDAVDQQHRGRLRQRHPGAEGRVDRGRARARSRRCWAPTAPARRRRLKAISGVLRIGARRGHQGHRSQLAGRRIDGMRAHRRRPGSAWRRCSRAGACSST